MPEKQRIYFDPEKFKALRERKGWSQQQLANWAKVNVSAIKDYENSEATRGCQRETFKKLVKVVRWEELKRVVREGQQIGEQWAEEVKRSQPRGRTQEKPKIFPNILPPEPDLIGRDDQLEAVKERLFTEDKRNRFALHGIPGVGKTALALKLVYDGDVREHFDGILWAALGKDGDVLAQLGVWASQLGISEEALKGITTIERRAERIRIEIKNRRMLLVADDVWKEKAAASFIIGSPNCVQLITARSPKIAVKFAGKRNTISVTKLTKDDGLKLLQSLAKETIDAAPEKAAKLVETVGGLPLALILMGKYLEVAESSGVKRIKWTIDQLLEVVEERLRLAEPQSSQERHPSLPEETDISLMVLIQISDEALGKEARGVLCALSVFPPEPNTFSDEAALAVAVASNEVFYEVVDSGLLGSNKQGRYFLHQTIADYARFQRAEEVKAGRTDEAIFERMAKFFVDYLKIYQNDYSTVEVEQENVRVILQWSMEFRRFDSAANLVIPFYEFLESRGLYNQAYKMTQEVVKTAHEEDIADTLPLLLRNMGRVERYQGNTAKARETYLAGLSKAKERDDKKTQAMLLMSVGATYCDAGEFVESIPYFEDGLQLARTIGHHETMCSLLQNLGFVEEYRGNYDRAEEYLKEGLALAREMGNDEKLCTTLMHVGRVAEDRGVYEQAEAYYQEGLALAQKMKHQARICALLACLGTVVFRRGVQRQGEVYLKDGLSLAREIKYHDMICMLLENLGVIEMERGAYGQAMEYFNEGLSLAREMGYRDKVCSLLHL